MPLNLRGDNLLDLPPVDGDRRYTVTPDVPSCNLSSKLPGQRSRRVLVIVTAVTERAESRDDHHAFFHSR